MQKNYENETLKNNKLYKVYKEGFASTFSKFLKNSIKIAKYPNEEEFSPKSKKIELMNFESTFKKMELRKSKLFENDIPDLQRFIALQKAEIDQIHKIAFHKDEINKIQKLNSNWPQDIDLENITKNIDSRDSSNISRFHNETSYFNKGLTFPIKEAPHLGDEEISDSESNIDIYQRIKPVVELKNISWASQKSKYLICDDPEFEIILKRDFSKFPQYFHVTFSFKNKNKSMVSNVNISTIGTEG